MDAEKRRKQEMNLDYITVNGLNQSVKTMMEDDIKCRNYKGTVSAYVTQLLSEALSARREKDEIADASSVKEINKSLIGIEKRLDGIENAQCLKGSEDEVYRQLICRIYMFLVRMCYLQNIDIEPIEQGKFDKLPWGLEDKLKEVNDNYANS